MAEHVGANQKQDAHEADGFRNSEDTDLYVIQVPKSLAEELMENLDESEDHRLTQSSKKSISDQHYLLNIFSHFCTLPPSFPAQLTPQRHSQHPLFFAYRPPRMKTIEKCKVHVTVSTMLAKLTQLVETVSGD